MPGVISPLLRAPARTGKSEAAATVQRKGQDGLSITSLWYYHICVCDEGVTPECDSIETVLLYQKLYARKQYPGIQPRYARMETQQDIVMSRVKTPSGLPKRLIDRLQRNDQSVKSAQRVLEILEFFDDYRSEATVVQIADSLGYPQSSTSALLKSLVNLGYLQHNPVRRTFISSPRVALLGAWIGDSFAREGDLVQLMRNVSDETGEAVVLITRNGLHAQYIHVIQSKNPQARWIGTGHLRSLASSGAGLAILSTMSDREVTKLVMRINSEVESREEIVNVRELLNRLAEVRRVGYAVAVAQNANCGLVARPLPRAGGSEQLMLGLCADGNTIMSQAPRFAELLREAIDNQFSLRAAG